MTATRTDDLWLRADLAVLLLHQEAVKTGDRRLRIREATLRQWVRRGYITYQRGQGYNVHEIFRHVQNRSSRGHHTRPS